MKKQLTLIGVFAIIFLSGCTDNGGEYFEEIVKVSEVKTEITPTGFVRHYFKSNSSITDGWMAARNRQPFASKWFYVGVNDTIELIWYLGSGGIIISRVNWLSKGE